MPIKVISANGLSDLAHGLTVAALIIYFFYIAGAIVQPLIIAALLSFILAPAMRRFRVWGLPKFLSALFSVVLTLIVLGALGTTLALQVGQLADDLPRYENNLRAKIQVLGGAPLASGALERASGTLRDLQSELNRVDSPQPPPGTQIDSSKPLPVEIRQPESKGFEALANLVRPLLSPLATSALVVLFLLFLLLQREDIRDRLLRLAGTADLHRSTAALDDGASRLSKFFLMQTLLNSGFGIFIAAMLFTIGVPNPVLWGILAGLLRFVPFVGSLIAAFFPVAVAAGADPGWSKALMTAGLFLISEPAAGQIVEPLVYGPRTGLSPVAVVLSTLFWTLLWGPIGLLIATPLTVCLVVLGKHIEGLSFVAVLLGDEPPLQPEERLYHRLLAGDATDAADQAEEELKTRSLLAYYDAVPMKALVLAQIDAAERKLDTEKQFEIRDTLGEIIDILSEYEDADCFREADSSASSGGERASENSLIYEGGSKQNKSKEVVLCVGSRSSLDEAAAAMLGQVLEKRGITALIKPVEFARNDNEAGTDASTPRLVCVSYFGAMSRPAHVRYRIRRFKRALPHARFVACFWMLGGDLVKAEEWRNSVGADFVATSLEQAALICSREMRDTSAPSISLPNVAGGA
jgi:predicted PurR-regulated permease PerM